MPDAWLLKRGALKLWSRLYRQGPDWRVRHRGVAAADPAPCWEWRFGGLGYQAGVIYSRAQGVGCAVWRNATYDLVWSRNWLPA